MMRTWISKVAPLGFRGPGRTFCNAQCIFQRGQWGNEHLRGDGRGQRNYGDQGNRGDWGGQRGGRRDYGDQGNQGDWGGQRGGRRDYGDQGNQGDWGGQRGGRRDYGDQGNQGDWGGQRGGRRDYGDQGNRGDWGGQRGGRRDYGDQGNQGDWGGQRGGRRDYGDQGNQGDWGGQRGGRRDYGDQGNRGDWGGQRGGRRDYGDQGNQGDWGGQRGGRRDYGDQGNQGDWGGQRGGRRDYGDQGNQGDWGGQRGGRRDYGDQGNRGDWGGQRGGRRDYGDQGNQGDWGGQRGGRRDYGDQGNQGDWGGQRGGRRDYGDQGNRGDWGGQRGGRRDYGDQGNRVDRGDAADGSGRTGPSRGGYSDRRGQIEDGNAGEERIPDVPFDEQTAKSLFEMKRKYKSAKTGKERRDIQRDARRLIRRARVDPSTQDEKTVTLLLNCAVTFRSYPQSEGIRQAVEWMRQNIEALSPQNLALFANAVGALSLIDSDTILLQEISPAVQSVFTQMSPVELVMVLQAFQRGKIVSNAFLQESMLRQLAPCVTQMPAQQLSTLAGVLVKTPFRNSDMAAWRGLTDAVLTKAVSGVEKMHSREVITLLKAAPHLSVPEEQSLQLVDRAIQTAGFHTDEQIGELFEAVAEYRTMEAAPGESLREKLDELVSVLWTRLNKVAPYTDAISATRIMRQARRCGLDVPLYTMEPMLEAVVKDMRFHRYTFRRCAALAEALTEQKAPAKVLLHMLGDYCIGKRPPREDQDEADIHEEDTPREVRMDIVARFFGDLTRARLALEYAYSAHSDNGEPGESVRVLLPERLEEGALTASPRELLKSVRAICTSSEECEFRNVSNDEKIMALVEQRISKGRESFLSDIPKERVEEFHNVMKDTPRAKKVIQILFS